jgi:hypothetical protein
MPSVAEQLPVFQGYHCTTELADSYVAMCLLAYVVTCLFAYLVNESLA